MVAFFVLLFTNPEAVAVPGEVMKPALFLFVGFCAVMSWFTGGYVAVATTAVADQEEAKPSG